MKNISNLENEYDDHIALNYDQTRTQDIWWNWETQTIDELLNYSQSSILIDLPAGTGRIIDHYLNLKNSKFLKLFLVDSSNEMLNFAKKKIPQSRDDIYIFNQSLVDFDFTLHENFDILCFRLFHLYEDSDVKKMLEVLMKSDPKNLYIQIFWVFDKNLLRMFRRFMLKIQGVPYPSKLKYFLYLILSIFGIRFNIFSLANYRRSSLRSSTSIFVNNTYSHSLRKLLKTAKSLRYDLVNMYDYSNYNPRYVPRSDLTSLVLHFEKLL